MARVRRKRRGQQRRVKGKAGLAIRQREVHKALDQACVPTVHRARKASDVGRVSLQYPAKAPPLG